MNVAVAEKNMRRSSKSDTGGGSTYRQRLI